MNLGFVGSVAVFAAYLTDEAAGSNLQTKSFVPQRAATNPSPQAFTSNFGA